MPRRMGRLRRAAAVAVLAAVALRPGAARAAVTVTVTPDQGTLVEGYPCAFTVTIHNGGAADVAISSGGMWTVSTSPSTRGSASANSAPLPDRVPAGGDVVTGGIFYPTSSGGVTITATINAIAGAPAGSFSRTVLSTNEAAAAHPAGPHGMTIRHNIVRLKYGTGGTSAGFVSPALVLLHGAPGGKVRLDIAGPTGRPLGEINRTFFVIGQDSGSTVTLNDQGNGSCTVEGSANGVQLGTGMFWVMASGAVTARAPLLVISAK